MSDRTLVRWAAASFVAAALPTLFSLLPFAAVLLLEGGRTFKTFLDVALVSAVALLAGAAGGALGADRDVTFLLGGCAATGIVLLRIEVTR